LDSFGKLEMQTNAAIDFLFGNAGRPRDEATELTNSLHRWDDPQAQRWLNPDPSVFDGGQTNLDVYCGNNPINATDPTGLTWASNAAFLNDFLHGTGPTIRHYGPTTIEVTEMRAGAGAEKLRHAFYAGGGASITYFRYGTVEAAADTMPYPWTTPFQVGGWEGSATNTGHGTVKFRIVNYASKSSFLLHLPVRSPATGPMRTITQIFEWEEPIDPLRLRARK